MEILGILAILAILHFLVLEKGSKMKQDMIIVWKRALKIFLLRNLERVGYFDFDDHYFDLLHNEGIIYWVLHRTELILNIFLWGTEEF